MTLRSRIRLASGLAVTVLLTACGGSGGLSANSQARAVVVMASAPNSLDPAAGDGPQALEADWLAYTPLMTYVHADGARGTRVVPGLAQYLPSISDGGRVYTFTLIKGLSYSSGQPVHARDVAWAAERAIKLWPPAARLLTSHIVGAAAFAAGRAKTISGITTDDASGEITIHLTAPYGAIENVLALPALAPVPAGTPFTDLRTAPPAGVGPYRITAVIPGRSFSLVRTPGWSRGGVQAVPAGHLDIDVRITDDAAENARSVLRNTADVFDWPDQIPASVLDQIKQRASDRYATRTMAASDLIFLDVTRKPFSSGLAREAVRVGLGQARIASLASGRLQSGCYVLPPTVFGHPSNPCPGGDATGSGNVVLARALVKRSGMAGTHVLVSTESTAPVSRWMAYYASLLDQVGFRARLEDRASDAQTGYTGLGQLPPNPVYFYEQLLGASGRSTLDDPYVTSSVHALTAIPGSTVSGVATFWSQLERYVANRGYVGMVGYPTAPEFVSSRMNFRALIFSPVVGVDWSSLRLP